MNKLLAKTFDTVLFGSRRTDVFFQKAVQRLIHGPRTTEICFRGGILAEMRFVCMTSEKFFFERENYESHIQKVLLELTASDSICYDIGAHVGFWVLFLSRLAKKVIALEPSLKNWERLMDNVSLNHVENAICLNYAASERDGEMGFSENGSSSFVDDHGHLRVRTVRLDDLVATYGIPSVLLLDVEGHAGAVLRGASAALEHHPIVVCEIHSPAERNEVLGILKNLRYEIQNLTGRRSFPFHVVGTHRPLFMTEVDDARL